MEDTNIIILLDKLKKEIERGALPIAIGVIESTTIELERNISKGKGKRFLELPSPFKDEHSEELRMQYNCIIRFLNGRFPL